MKSKLTWIAALVLALGLIAAGCGGDDDGNDAESETTGTVVETEATISKAEFVEQANEICAQGNKEIQQAGEELGQGTSEEELNSFVNDTLIPNIQGQIDEMRALGLPDDQIAGILDRAEQLLSDLDAESLQGGNDPFAEVNKELKAYGLTECSDG